MRSSNHERDHYVALAAAVILSGVVQTVHDEKSARDVALRHARALGDELFPDEDDGGTEPTAEAPPPAVPPAPDAGTTETTTTTI